MTAFETAPGQSDEISHDPGPTAAARRTSDARHRASQAIEAGPGLRERLVPPMPGSAFWGWAGPLLVTLLGGIQIGRAHV